jgi:hypothetical protein
MLRLQKSPKLIVCATLLGLPVAIGLALPAQAATFTNTTINFNESVFPVTTAAINGTQSYNLLNDATGTITPNSGNPDITITYANSGAGALSSTGTPKLVVDTTPGSIVSTRGYQGTVKANNPGTLVSTTTTLKFLPQWNITDLQAKFTSLNTASIAWEYSLVGFLKPDGTPFTAAPTIGSYQTNTLPTGSPSRGWYLAADKTTVTGVGSDLTESTKKDGTKDNLTLTYALAGLDANTPVGGLIWTTWLEDVRGLKNGGSDLTASLTSLTLSGSNKSAEPVPTPALLPGLIALAAGVRRRSKAAQ